VSETLQVRYDGRLAGVLSLRESGQMEFGYVAEWRQDSASFPISVSLPLDGGFDTTAGHRFFVNLLPEGTVRQQICRAVGISEHNDFGLLKAIGGDCAGALTVSESSASVESERNRSGVEPRYEELSEEQLATWSAGGSTAFSAVTGRNDIRLSLAGAQDKLPVAVQGDRIFVPVGGTPSTHLLKFASRFYSHLPENQTYTTMLARRVGLPVADVVLRTTGKRRVAVITRFDRVCRNGSWYRLHQEDFCQALGISSAAKYEKEGGPSLSKCAEILRAHSTLPLPDLQQLIQWTLFNLIVGNSDAHGKNISLLYAERDSIRLAPFYDLVCTRNYDRISRHLAMRIGGETDPGQIGRRQLHALSAELKMNPRMIISSALQLCDQLMELIPATRQEFEDRFGVSPVLERIGQIIRQQVRRLRRQLSEQP
jgi:serine/threonine-protein kinase HipA